jgi:molybdate transport system substrate-binding protein
MRHALRFGLLAFALLSGSAQATDPGQPGLLVFAASSLTDALQEIGAAYARDTGQPAKFSFAASAVVARQIESGARADVFVSADVEWMDYLAKRGLIDASTRRDVAGNRLVLVAPADSTVRLTIAPGFALAAALGNGRLATGDPDYVPAGRYARSALMALGAWDSVASRLARTDNVRSALAFVARGEAPLGIVYRTDALIESRVRIVDLFPESSHPPIAYPAAAIRNAAPGAARFVEFLGGSTGRAIFARYGFIAPH